MPRFRLTLAYDGRSYAGWQSQPNRNTIQDITLESLRHFCPAIDGVHGSGRTDAGVSATGQIAHFDVSDDWNMDGESWTRALNSRLPKLIRVLETKQVEPSFHARFSATAKTYRYDISATDILDPLRVGLAWHLPKAPPLEDVGAAFRLFEGCHDFRAFSAKRGDGFDDERETERTVFEAKSEQIEPGEWRLTITGNGFLYKMVRFLVGTSIQVARGKIAANQVETWLRGDDLGSDGPGPFCAPADGLSLVSVSYEPEKGVN
ncbi:MAG: tRNA pseudouridine(38-40) synthase TruA [Verrucomicrobiota bacterium]